MSSGWGVFILTALPAPAGRPFFVPVARGLCHILPRIGPVRPESERHARRTGVSARDRVRLHSHDVPVASPVPLMTAEGTQVRLLKGTGLHYHAPAPDMTAHFGAQYLFHSEDRLIEEQTRADFAQIRFMLAGAGHYVFADGREVRTPDVCLLGPTSMATPFRLVGPAMVVGISVLPLGWAALGLGNAVDLADDVLDLASHFGPDWLALLARLRSAETCEEGSYMLSTFLRGRMKPDAAADRAFVTATDAWLANRRSPQIADLQAATGLGARQVARLCNRLYGAPPKFLARKYRALRCALEIARDERPWTELAGEDFYDQSHFIREIRHFTGLTPTDLRERASIVLRLTMKRSELEGELALLSRVS